jgi:hypothetical protein
MKCPHCKNELPDNHGARWCSFCGKDLPGSATYAVETPSSSPQLAPVKVNWLVFFAVLIAPPLLTLITASTVGGRNEQVSPIIGLYGGGAAGIICGLLLGLRLGKTVLARVVLGVLFSVVMAFLCIMLCLLGCTMGGYQFRMM